MFEPVRRRSTRHWRLALFGLVLVQVAGAAPGSGTAIGKLADHKAKEIIEAKGSVLTPGFIDMQSHSDLALLKDGRGLSKIRQGVTTEIIGEGESVAPRKADAHDSRFGVKPDFLTRAASPALRARIKKEISEYMNTKYFNEYNGAQGFDAVIIASVPKNAEKYVGRTIGDIARAENKAPDDETLDLLIEEGGDVSIVMIYMSEQDMRAAIADPLVSFDSDGTAVSPDFGGQPHPRYYGTFPRRRE